MLATQARLAGRVAQRGEGLGLLANPGDFVLIERGRPRAMLMMCPDGCGEVLTMNLDPRTGKAWRAYLGDDGFTLYPSVWRTTGCLSHFYVWRDRIYWSRRYDASADPSQLDAHAKDVIAAIRTGAAATVVTIADHLSLSPWLVAFTCSRLVDAGILREVDHTEEDSAYRLAGGV